MPNITKTDKNEKKLISETEETTKKWYDITPVWNLNCDYTLVDGQKGNGKTDSTLRKFMEYCYPDSDFIYLRRMDEDIKIKNGIDTMFNAIVQRGFVKELTEGKYDRVKYYNGDFYYAKTTEDKNGTVRILKAPEPFCTVMSISKYEHYTGKPYATTKGIYFDEFIPKVAPLPNEFAKFLDLYHSIRRDKEEFRVVMTANLNNVSNLYFTNFGINRKQKQGTIVEYVDRDNGRRVAREFCALKESSEKIEKAFSFDDERFNTILKGRANTSKYPPYPYDTDEGVELLFRYFIQFETDIYQCEILQKDGELFTFIFPKTTGLKEKPYDLIFSQSVMPSQFRRVNLFRPVDDIGRKIKWFFDADKVFYSDNDTGEMIKNYRVWCSLGR